MAVDRQGVHTSVSVRRVVVLHSVLGMVRKTNARSGARGDAERPSGPVPQPGGARAGDAGFCDDLLQVPAAAAAREILDGVQEFFTLVQIGELFERWSAVAPYGAADVPARFLVNIQLRIVFETF